MWLGHMPVAATSARVFPVVLDSRWSGLQRALFLHVGITRPRSCGRASSSATRLATSPTCFPCGPTKKRPRPFGAMYFVHNQHALSPPPLSTCDQNRAASFSERLSGFVLGIVIAYLEVATVMCPRRPQCADVGHAAVHPQIAHAREWHLPLDIPR